MEQGKKQSESDSSMAAAMENLSTQQQLWHSQEEDLKKEIAANEAKFKVSPFSSMVASGHCR